MSMPILCPFDSTVGFRCGPGPSCSKGGWSYPLDSSISFPKTYPLDSDLSGR